MSTILDNRAAAPAGLSDARVSGLIVALVALTLFAVAAFTPAVLNDGDTWSHLATGEWILAHRAIPRADPFSWSMPGAPWTAHEWLSEIVVALAFRAGGWSGVALLTAFAAAFATVVLGLSLAKNLSGAALGVVLALDAGLWAPTLLARPHVLALPLAAIWTAGLIAARERDASPPIALTPVMTLWANLHGGFAFGLALIAAFAGEAVLAAPAGARLPIARGWAWFACAAVAAALVNPYGVEALVFPFRLMSVEHLARVSEWSSQDFGRLGPMEIALIALVGFALTQPMRTAPIRAALVVALIAMALAHARHAQLLGLVAPMLLAQPIRQAIGEPAPKDVRAVQRTTFVVFISGALAFAGLRAAVPIVRADGPGAPMAALAAVPAELRERRVLNDYGFGGYLIFLHVPPFIDGRADMYGGAMLDLYGRLADGDASAIEATLARDRIAWTIFAPNARIVSVLDREPAWRRFYADDVAVVHVRGDALAAASGDRGAR